jgi:ABC-2 type transport system permease protein
MKEVLISSPASAVSAEFSGQSNRPSFAGLLWAEWLKISRQWQTWALFVLQACFLGGFYLIELTLSRSNLKLLLRSDPLVYAYRLVHGLDCVRVFGGICLIIVAARCVGLEYQLGTVRVLLARGVGRVQLLLAKLVTLFLVATLLLLIDLLLAALSSTHKPPVSAPCFS